MQRISDAVPTPSLHVDKIDELVRWLTGKIKTPVVRNVGALFLDVVFPFICKRYSCPQVCRWTNITAAFCQLKMSSNWMLALIFSGDRTKLWTYSSGVICTSRWQMVWRFYELNVTEVWPVAMHFNCVQLILLDIVAHIVCNTIV